MSNQISAIDSKTETLLNWAESIIQQTHYEVLDSLIPRPLNESAISIPSSEVTCLYRITELVFKRNEGNLGRLTTVLNSLYTCGASALLLLQNRNGKCELYLGAVNKQRYDNPNYINTIRDVLRSGIEGNFPGTELTEIVSRSDINDKIEQCLNNGFDSQCVTAISCVASDVESERAQGIETLLEAVGDKDFSILVLADPIDSESMKGIRLGYENLYTQLSSNSEMSISVQTGRSTTISEGLSDNFSRTVSDSISLTQSHTVNSGWSKSTSQNQGDKSAKAKLTKSGAVGAGLLAAKVGANAAAGAINPFFAMSAVNNLFGSTSQSGESETQSGGTSDQAGQQATQGTGTTVGKTINKGKATAKTKGFSVQSTSKNRHIIELMNRVEWYLNWLNRFENYGMFNCCTYVISSSASVNLMVASQYQALMQGKRDMNQPVSINTWTAENGVNDIKDALIHMSHPIIDCIDIDEGVSPAMILSSKELSRHFALPNRSVVGLTVMEYAHFGREVVRKTPLNMQKVIRIGSISHMGKAIKKQPVLLDLQSMAAHTFVSGTNGSGKSNTIFKILDEMMKASIPFMVIEPAKGEYKNVFGHRPNVKVYGTNKKKTELLKLNPFWFNDDVDILEHIDMILQVFNASWSMSAAMPAVLKAAIENAYIECGWNLKTSKCEGDIKIYPTVSDVLSQFNKKMKSTAFSEEVKGNYVGALSTRMESLCNGIYGEIFGGNNLSDDELFNSNVIVDLSRVGSEETKSMIMGMLIIRLSEYRMTSNAMNHPLKHVTVLEEAHHLLRKTSFSQSNEGTNLVGKSVEMLSTSIAEMRSFGEGFIIVDQSPGLLDSSVIRNTNTKIVLRLPDGSDREVVGNTMGLTQEQIFEISRLNTGVCVIYQKDWLEAVCCQVEQVKLVEKVYVQPVNDTYETSQKLEIIKMLIAPFVKGKQKSSNEQKNKIIEDIGLSGLLKRDIIRMINNPAPNFENIGSIVNSILDDTLSKPHSLTEQSVNLWFKDMLKKQPYCEAGEIYASIIIRARISAYMKADSEWKQVFEILDADNPVRNMALLKARGLAFKKICPLFCKSCLIESEALNEAYKLLINVGDEDRELADRLKLAIQKDIVRDKLELEPYASLAWKYLGEETTWKKVYPYILDKNANSFQSIILNELRKTVITDTETELSIISLFLQKRGSDMAVKSFYHMWFKSVYYQKQKSDVKK